MYAHALMKVYARLVHATALIVAATAASAASAATETCDIQNASAPGRWKFVRVYDVADGKVVLSQAMNGGDLRPVTVKGRSVRVEYKLAGDLQYHSSRVASCHKGAIVKI